jgi:hypothetical protein
MLNVLLLNLFTLNGTPLFILDGFEDEKTCKLAISEIQSMKMPTGESYQGWCIEAPNLSILPVSPENVTASIYDARVGNPQDEVFGWDVDTGVYKHYDSLTKCLATKNECGYLFQGFSYDIKDVR